MVDSKFIRESARGLDILLFVIAQPRRNRNLLRTLHCLDDVTSGTSGDVKNSDRTSLAVNFLDNRLQCALEIGFSLPDAAPADAVKIRFIDPTAHATRTARLILVNVIER